ncbi:UPF0481 protein At3g47200-like [Ananas comosus]|uniref:UPF0481 protein At3g47200-like n=2 Tax=Ananas comosus TaxID=4615 RepID=A0A6P5FG94_ANACO|nr:UPF0481 protein At3g47200-like [Ananas comosus]XP_020092271.1 UPF0481 protein At3g47200-like [Ananas comosus]
MEAIEGMARLEVPLISVADDVGTSSEKVNSGIAEEATSSVTESSMNVDCWIKEVEKKCKGASEGLLWQSKMPDDKGEQLSQQRAVAIGPFNRDKSTHITDKEKYLIVHLMNNLYDHLDLEGCFKMIKNQVVDARKWYSDSDMPESFGSTNDNTFAEMLLLDSCFILFMLTSISEIHSKVTREGVILHRHYCSKSLKIMPGKLFGADSSKKQEIKLALDVVPRFAGILRHKDMIMVDLLTLQNQIPFFVIEELFKKLQLENPLHKYALKFFKTVHPRSTQGCKGKNSPPKFLHLLHLFHWSRVPKNKCDVLRSWRPQLDDFYWDCKTPSVMELGKSATGFRKKTSGSSLDISFGRGRLLPIVPVLNIPRLHIREYSSRIFRNLIAFEMQRPRSDRRTMAFSVIMQNLLQSEEDVKLFRQCGILANTCMTDNKIVNFFKSLSLSIGKDDMPIDVYVFCHQVLSYHNGRIS